MTEGERDLYWTLLVWVMRDGKIPASSQKLSQLTPQSSKKFAKNWSGIKHLFVPTSDSNFVTNLKALSVHQEAVKRLENGRSAGIASGQKRTLKSTGVGTGVGTGVAPADGTVDETGVSIWSQQTDTDTDIDTTKTPLPPSGDSGKKEDSDYTDLFLSFWKAYPKKTGKGAAFKAWKKIREPAKTLGLILEALEWQKESYDWTKEGGKFIKHPQGYLNARMWEDEKPQQQSQSGEAVVYGGGTPVWY